MNPCARGAEPPLLQKHAAGITRRHLQKRGEFKWPRREKQSLRCVVLDALRGMTQNRCSYCDAYPITSASREHIDHFRPKALFPERVCEWENLFLSCSACNEEKSEKWDEALLRPDAPDFSFERYFNYRFDTGNLEPNPAAKQEEQQRARATIEIFKLNREGACSARKKEARAMKDALHDDFGYRFLLPLCRDFS